MVTHDHFDHDAVWRAGGLPTVVRHPVGLDYRDLRLTGFADWHVAGHSGQSLANIIFMLESGGVRVCHLGDNRFPPPTEIVDQIGRVDVLIVPADDSCHLLNYDEVDGFIDLFKPRIAIPAHYLIPGITGPESTLSAAGLVMTRHENVQRIAGVVELNPDRLPDRSEIWLMDADVN